jgi:hypothetical protein
LKPAYDEDRIAATWGRIDAARRSPRRSTMMRAVVSGALVIAATAAIAMWPRTHRVGPLTSHDPTVNLTPGAVLVAGHDVVFDDQSTIALAVGTRLQVLANEGARFATLLETGSAKFTVTPGGERRWEIETALASVEVVGTAFTMTLRDHQLEVSVDRGVVIVNGERVPGRVVRLTAGQRIVVDQAPATAAIPAPAPAPAPAPEAPAITSPASAPITAPVQAPRPQKRAVVAAPLHAAEPVEAQPESLAAIVARADQLSSTGDPEGAAKLLEGLRATDRASGLVLFTLGRLYLDVLDKPELAAIVFGEMIDRGSPRSLLEDAYARRVEALQRAGLRNRALAAFADYTHAYPESRRIAALRAKLEAP